MAIVCAGVGERQGDEPLPVEVGVDMDEPLVERDGARDGPPSCALAWSLPIKLRVRIRWRTLS